MSEQVETETEPTTPTTNVYKLPDFPDEQFDTPAAQADPTVSALRTVVRDVHYPRLRDAVNAVNEVQTVKDSIAASLQDPTFELSPNDLGYAEWQKYATNRESLSQSEQNERAAREALENEINELRRQHEEKFAPLKEYRQKLTVLESAVLDAMAAEKLSTLNPEQATKEFELAVDAIKPVADLIRKADVGINITIPTLNQVTRANRPTNERSSESRCWSPRFSKIRIDGKNLAATVTKDGKVKPPALFNAAAAINLSLSLVKSTLERKLNERGVTRDFPAAVLNEDSEFVFTIGTGENEHEIALTPRSASDETDDDD